MNDIVITAEREDIVIAACCLTRDCYAPRDCRPDERGSGELELLVHGNIVHPSQKALTAAVYHEAYVTWRDDISAFDTANVDATITNREAKRAVAASQPWADKWLIQPTQRARHHQSMRRAMP